MKLALETYNETVITLFVTLFWDKIPIHRMVLKMVLFYLMICFEILTDNFELSKIIVSRVYSVLF